MNQLYLIYFSNGEEGYLSHSGVKGMKWGVWNEETRARHVREGDVSVEGGGGGGSAEEDGETVEDRVAKWRSDMHKADAYNALKQGDVYKALLESVRAVEDRKHGPYAHKFNPELDMVSVFTEVSVKVLSETEPAKKAKENIDNLMKRKNDMEKAKTLNEEQRDALRTKRDLTIKANKRIKKVKRDEAIKNRDIIGFLNNL